MPNYELRTAEPGDEAAGQLVWNSDGSNSSTVRADIDPWLSPLGDVPGPAIDLVRIALAALIADRLSPRGTGWSRSIGLRVHVVEIRAWQSAADQFARLLGFLSGDSWDLELIPDATGRGTTAERQNTTHKVALFSGGLDSFAGALLALAEAGRSQEYHPPIFVSHRDNPFVAHAQNEATEWIRRHYHPGFLTRVIHMSQAERVRENSSRSRSLLYASLAVAAALGAGADQAGIPENGFTSLNPPLGADRGGALSTRSTHPGTFALLNDLLEALGLDIVVENPHEWMTKGELVAAAAGVATEQFADGCAATLSCGKLDGARYKGGNGNLNCGLCVNCLVRRSAIAAAGVEDKTEYLVGRLTGSELARLRRNRSADMLAVQAAIAAGADEDTLIGTAPYPPGFDIDRAVAMYSRGLEELGQLDVW